ncbi:MAG TPA: amidase, partial [Roseiflexaceae bacterium]|nr:amidase [Roseiflexaceae bacterium]
MAQSLTELSIAEAAAALAAQTISPVELVRSHLDRIAQIDGLLNSVITLTANAALEEAHGAAAAIAAGKYRGALHGIPIALKDLYETRGVRTTAGTRFLREYVPTADCEPVARLRDAGAISLAKLNMHEWALGITNENPHYGAVANPWDPARISGGSSGGSAAAVAAQLCMAALGSDTGGSIRIPAALCGIVGLKPTFGRISVRGVIPLSWNLDHVGPMTRSVEDAAIMLSALAGYDPRDPWSVNMPVDDYLAELGAGVRGMRIGLAIDSHFGDADAPILAAVQAAADRLQELGAELHTIDLGDAAEARA